MIADGGWPSIFEVEPAPLDRVAEDFHKLHPNITVEFQLVPTERATDKLINRGPGRPRRGSLWSIGQMTATSDLD